MILLMLPSFMIVVERRTPVLPVAKLALMLLMMMMINAPQPQLGDTLL